MSKTRIPPNGATLAAAAAVVVEEASGVVEDTEPKHLLDLTVNLDLGALKMKRAGCGPTRVR